MADDSKDEFFSALKEMEQQATTCANKATFLDAVVSGREQVTFAVIDRCREAVLQLRQSHHVLKRLLQKHKSTTLGNEHKSRLHELETNTESVAERAAEALHEIISWVPEAVNTRATSFQR